MRILFRALSLVPIIIFSFLILVPGRPIVAQTNPLSFCEDPTFKGKSSICEQSGSSGKIDDANNGIFSQIIKVIVFLTAGLSTLFVIIGAFKYVTSQGEASQIKSAKDSIMYALIGLFIAVSAFVIVSFVVSKT